MAMEAERKVLIPDDGEGEGEENDSISSTQKEIPDEYNKTYISYFIIGIGLLLPWNFFINADRYFKDKLKDNESDRKMFESAFSICSQIPCGVALVINLFLTNRVSRDARVITTLAISIICFTMTTVLAKIDTSSWTDTFFYTTLVSVAIINFCSGIFQGTIFGIAGVTGPRYIQGTIVGMSVAGTFASISDIASLAIGNNIQTDTTVYFSIGTIILFICIAAYVIMNRQHVVINKLELIRNTANSQHDAGGRRAPSVFDVIKKIYPLALSVTSIYTVTIGLMPAVLSGIQSVNVSDGSAWTNKYFTATAAFLVFNVGDFAGRIVSGSIKIVGKDSRWLPVMCISRIVFIMLLALCNYHPRYFFPVVFKHDAYLIVFNLMFAVSNGYLTSLCMMYGPQLVEVDSMEIAGVTMQLFLTLGTGLGSLLSLLLVNVI